MKPRTALFTLAGSLALTAGLAALARRAVPMRGRITRGPDGRRARVIDEGQGPLVVLIHGLGGQPENFARLIPLLTARGFRVLAPDRAGAGRSDPAPPGGASLYAQAARIAALIEAERAGPAIVLGHSLGGAVALQLAADRPDLLRGLVLAGALTRPERADLAQATLAVAGFPPLREGLARVLTGPGVLLTGGLVKWLSFAPERMPRGFAFWGGGLLIAQPRAIAGVMRDIEVVAEGIAALQPRLPGLTLPVRVLHGAGDLVLAPAHARHLSRLPQAQVQIVPGAGHMLPVTQPDRLADAVAGL